MVPGSAHALGRKATRLAGRSKKCGRRRLLGRTRSPGRSLEWIFFNHQQNEFSRMGSGSAIVFQGRDRQVFGVPRFRRAAAFLLDAKAALPRKWDPDGAASLQEFTRCRAECDSGGASSSHAPFSSREAAVLRGLRGARGDGERAGCWRGCSGLGQANRSPGWGGGSTSQMARRAQRAGARARQRSTLQGSTRFRAE